MSEQYIYSRAESPASPRVVLPTGAQRRLLETIYQRLGQSGWRDVARLCGVHPRTLHDWRREKLTISLAALVNLRRRWPDIPAPVTIVSPFQHVRRAGHLGAVSRYRRYGNPGTETGRRKGGRATQRLFLNNPQRAKEVGFVTRKSIQQPPRSEPLAEFLGVLLGDGHISRYQVMVYLNRTEQALARHVQGLIRDLFGIVPTFHERQRNHLVVTASSRNLVEWLARHGVYEGDKIKRQATVPTWIFRRPAFMRACLRGLIDTDGTVFLHRHRRGGHVYQYLELGFSNYSPTLLRSTARLVTKLKFHARIYPKQGHVVMYRGDEVKRYMNEIGSHNPHHREQFRFYQSTRRGRVAAERTRLESA